MCPDLARGPAVAEQRKELGFWMSLQCCARRAMTFSSSVVTNWLMCSPRKEDVTYRKKSNHVLNHVGDGPDEAEVLIRDKKHNRKPSFLKALLRTFGPYFLIGSFFKLIQDLLSFVNPQLLRLVYCVSSFYVHLLWRLGFGKQYLFLKCTTSFPHSAACVSFPTFPLKCPETGVLYCGLSCKLDKLLWNERFINHPSPIDSFGLQITCCAVQQSKVISSQF